RETEAVEDLEYIGGIGGDITDPDNYFGYTIFEDSPTNGISLPTAGLWFGDIDGDGPLHMDLVFTAREPDTRRSGIFVIEYDPVPTSVEVVEPDQVPSEYELAQNYPNPFNPETTIEYSLPTPGRVTLDIYSLLGQKVRALVDDYQKAGVYKVQWDGKDDLGRNLATGVYFYRIHSGGFVQSRKLVLLR
ncbi:MAG: T9SS type A sorting domain-containing protein, partial [bacterium]